jgi:hypothetical protein
MYRYGSLKPGSIPEEYSNITATEFYSRGPLWKGRISKAYSNGSYIGATFGFRWLEQGERPLSRSYAPPLAPAMLD